jgi:DNA uptake protein ComE-like DNA-binding protein
VKELREAAVEDLEKVPAIGSSIANDIKKQTASRAA